MNTAIRLFLTAFAFGALSLCGASEAFSAHGPTSESSEVVNAPQPLTEGQLAPFSGMLVPFSTAAVLTAKAEHCGARINLARAEEQAVALLAAQLAQNLRDNDRRAHELKLKVLQDALSETGPGWWEHPMLWFGIGIVVSVATVAGSVAVLDATRPVVMASP